MEIERKFLLKKLPDNLNTYPCLHIEQAYLCRNPVIRIRRQNDEYILTYKGKGSMVREEYNLPLNRESYEHLLPKADGIILTKRRYIIPLEHSEGFKRTLTIELDVFEGQMTGTVLAEVEFQSEAEAMRFVPPDWFGEDVTFNPAYHNSNMCYR